jgi:hypothetical protein
VTLGVLATLVCNVAYGAPYGLSGELLSGWPAVAFVGSVEMVLVMVRRARTAPEPAAIPLMLAQSALADSAHAAQLALSASVAAGKVRPAAARRGGSGGLTKIDRVVPAAASSAVASAAAS